MELLQHTIRMLSGNPRLHLVQATRLEHSKMLCEYVNFKLKVRAQGVSNPGAALRAVLSEEQFKGWAMAASRKAFSTENIDADVNEVYLWAGVVPAHAGQLHAIRPAADAVRQSRRFFGNPG